MTYIIYILLHENLFLAASLGAPIGSILYATAMLIQTRILVLKESNITIKTNLLLNDLWLISRITQKPWELTT